MSVPSHAPRGLRLVAAAVLALACAAAPAASAQVGDGSAPLAPAVFDDPSQVERDASALFDAGVSTWREGRYERAGELWLAALARLGPRDPDGASADVAFDRHALLVNLGNAAFRAGRHGEAVGWYLAAERIAPRDARTRANLALARERAGLPAPSRGTLADLRTSLAGGVSHAEARWLAVLGCVVLAVGLVHEALRRTARSALGAVFAVVLCLAASTPLVLQELAAGDAPHLVLRPSVDVRSEPRAASSAVGAVAGGDVVHVVDALPEWLRVELPGGRAGWVPREDLFDLVR
jgi:hypothetical protein